MANVTKEVFLNTHACPTLGWLLANDQYPQQPLTLGQRLRMEQGQEIHRRARQTYPHGLHISDLDPVRAAQKTQDALANPQVSVIFEAAFIVDDFGARSDILVREPNGWHLIEVKSDLNLKPELINDLTYTALVIDRSGLKISNASLLLVSKDFRLGMPPENLFQRQDCRDQVLAQIKEAEPLWQQVSQSTNNPAMPDPQLHFECRQCDLFTQCLGRDADNHIFDLPRPSQSKFDDLVRAGIVRIEDIPSGFNLTDNQARVRDCALRGEPSIDANLATELDRVSWPAYYLDFETVMTAIPLYPDVPPYTQIPTQYSIHQCSVPGAIVDHHEYMADPYRDCRLELAQGLIEHLPGDGSIIVYTSFEKTTIRGFAQLHPHLSKELDGLIHRLVDLEAIIHNNFYHPDFHGSTSIKWVLPALVPELSYDRLSVGDGDSAMAAFAYLALDQDPRPEETKRNLLEYCQQDTLAMVKLHERLVAHVTS